MVHEFHQCAYDLHGKRLNTTNVWTPINFWNDACWHRSMPQDCRGLTYIDIGCNEGLYLLRFEQSGGKAFGLDPIGLGFYNELQQDKIGKAYDNKGFLILKDIYKTKYEAQHGGFSHGTLVPKQDRKFNIVSCMNTLEYVDELDTAISELFNIAKDRVIICTETSLDDPTWYASQYNARCINLNELRSKIPWPHIYWTLTVEERQHNEVFLVAESPESSLEPTDPDAIIFNLDITDTQKYRGLPWVA